MPYGSKVARRSNVLCPNCLTLERHRWMWIFLQQKTGFFNTPQRLLHIAPEQCFWKRFHKMEHIDYVTGDLESPLATHHFDLHNIPFNDKSFDVVFCNHVLEHVKDDAQCMRELYRVLRKGGWGIMQVPLDYSREATFQDDSIVTPEEREKHYWQKDHVRLYGKDYPNRLRAAGFEVEEFLPSQILTAGQIDRFRLQAEEVLYLCKKS